MLASWTPHDSESHRLTHHMQVKRLWDGMLVEERKRKAQTQAAVANAQVKLTYYQVSSGISIKNAEMSMAAQVQQAESRRAYSKSIADLGTANAHIYAGAANAAMSGMTSFAATILTQS